MKSVLYLLSVVVVVAGLLSSSAQALTPFGVPAATLDKDQFAVGFSFSRSKMDIVASVFGFDVTVPDNEVDTYMANLIFGVHNNWELQIDLGMSDTDNAGYSSTGNFAGGLGVRSTWVQDEKFKLGSVVAVHFYESTTSGSDFGVYWEETDKWTEFQFAVGPSYTEARWCLYGGPFLHLIDGSGDYSENGFSFSGDFEQDSMFGGFVGAQIEVANNTNFGFEYQMTGSANAFAFSILFRF